MSVREARAGCLHAAEPGLGIVLVATSELGRFVNENPGVMDGRRIPRAELDRLDMAATAQRDGHDEIPEDIGSVRRHGVRLGHGHNYVGSAQLPADRENRYLWQITWLTPERAVRDPSLDDLDVAIAQTSIATELTVFRVGLPRRHRATRDSLGDEPGPRSNVLVRHQIERSALAGPMAGCAVAKEERRDILIEGDASGFNGACGLLCGAPRLRQSEN